MCQKCAMNFLNMTNLEVCCKSSWYYYHTFRPAVSGSRFLSDTGWLWFEVSGFWFRNSHPPLDRALQLTRTKLVCKMENELSQLSVGDLASRPPLPRRMSGGVGGGVGAWTWGHSVEGVPSFRRETIPGVMLQQIVLPHGVLFLDCGSSFQSPRCRLYY